MHLEDGRLVCGVDIGGGEGGGGSREVFGDGGWWLGLIQSQP